MYIYDAFNRNISREYFDPTPLGRIQMGSFNQNPVPSDTNAVETCFETEPSPDFQNFEPEPRPRHLSRESQHIDIERLLLKVVEFGKIAKQTDLKINIGKTLTGFWKNQKYKEY